MRLEMHTVRVLINNDRIVYSNYISYIRNIMFSAGSFLSVNVEDIAYRELIGRPMIRDKSAGLSAY